MQMSSQSIPDKHEGGLVARSEWSDAFTAFFNPREHKFETVDFRLPASQANQRDYFPASVHQAINRARLAGLLGICVGIIVAIIGFIVDQLTRGLTLALYRAVDSLFNSSSFWLALIVFVFICLIFSLIAAIMVIYIAPLGAGSGIPELKSYLNGVRVPGFLAINSLFVKAIGVAFSISAGLICGKQGPMIHAGAIVGAGLSQAASSRFKWRLSSNVFKFLRTEAWKRDFTAVGAAVGVAVAFGSPMGAWMWVYEEACSHWTWDLGIITLGGCLSGAVMVRILNYLAAGIPYGFGAFSLTQFGKLVTPFDGVDFPLKDIPGFIIVGLIGGATGALLPLINKRITLFRYNHIAKPWRRIVETAIICLLTAVIRIVLPRIANDCVEVNEEIVQVLSRAPSQDQSQFICPDGQYSPWASVIYNPTDSVVRALLYTTSPDAFPAAAVAVAFVYYLVFIIWTYGIAVPAGVFFPGFLLGSVYGRLIGIAVQAIFPSRTDVSLTGYAFVGAVSALAGFTRTISVAVVALEATGSTNASFAVVFVSIISKLSADFLYKYGIYDLHINLKGIPYLSSNVEKLELYQKLQVSDVMERQVVGVRRMSRVGGLIQMLGTNDHHAFPVFLKLTNITSEAHNGDQLNPSQDFDITPPPFDEALSRASTEIEEELTRRERPSQQVKFMATTSIITPDYTGMRATIYDEGQTRLVQLTERGQVKVIAVGSGDPRSRSFLPPLDVKSYDKSPQSDHDDDNQGQEKPQSVANETEKKPSNPSSEPEIPDFELVGTIERGTLLTLLKYECDKRDGSIRNKNIPEDRDGILPREQLDAAWPNSELHKGRGEHLLLQQVRDLNITDVLVDLKPYINMDPLLMSDKAPSVSAYHLFRGTGARHILVTNMRSGRVSGIMTRKDILLSSIKEALEKLRSVKAAA